MFSGELRISGANQQIGIACGTESDFYHDFRNIPKGNILSQLKKHFKITLI